MTIGSTFQHLSRRAMQSPAVGNAVWLASATVVNGAVGAVASGIYARVLGVSDFGTFTLVVSLLTLMVALTDLGIAGSIVKFGTEKLSLGDNAGLQMVISIAFRFKLILTGVVFIVSVLFLDPIVRLLFGHVSPELPRYFAVSLLAFLFGAGATFFAPVFQVFGDFRKQAWLSMIPGAVKIILLGSTFLLLASVTVSQAIWFEAAGALLLLVVSYRFAPMKRYTLTAVDGGLSKSMLSFNKWLSLYFLISLLGGRMDIFFVGGMLDATALGVYGAANKIASLMVVLSNSYLSALLRDLAAAVTVESLKRKRAQAWGIVALIVFGLGLIAISSPLIIRIIYGPGFDDAAGLLRLMCAGVALNVLGYPFYATLFALNKTSVYPLMSALGLLALLLGNTYLVPLLQAYGAAYAFVASNGVSFITVAVYYALRKKKITSERFSMAHQIAPTGKSLEGNDNAGS